MTNNENTIIIPKTIEELKDWYRSNKFSFEDTKVICIGTNSVQPDATGIYFNTDTEEYIIYENDSDGKNNIKYQSKNEEETVEIFYDAFKMDIIKDFDPVEFASERKFFIKVVAIVTAVAEVFFTIPILLFFKNICWWQLILGYLIIILSDVIGAYRLDIKPDPNYYKDKHTYTNSSDEGENIAFLPLFFIGGILVISSLH